MCNRAIKHTECLHYFNIYKYQTDRLLFQSMISENKIQFKYTQTVASLTYVYNEHAHLSCVKNW